MTTYTLPGIATPVTAAEREQIFNDILQRAIDAGRAASDLAPDVLYCGMAWVQIADGRSAFSRWLIKSGNGGKHWTRGTYIWARTSEQAITKNEAYVRAMAASLRDEPALADVRDRIYTGSRPD